MTDSMISLFIEYCNKSLPSNEVVSKPEQVFQWLKILSSKSDNKVGFKRLGDRTFKVFTAYRLFQNNPPSFGGYHLNVLLPFRSMVIYVSDETSRKIMLYDAKTLEFIRSYQLQLQRASNSGFESIAYNSKKERFILVTEKNPITIQEYSKDFVLQGEIAFTSVRDISAASFYNGSLFLLSDEDHLLMKLSENYEIEKTWDLNLLNPEGFCFDENNNLIVISDDLEMLYNFGKIE